MPIPSRRLTDLADVALVAEAAHKPLESMRRFSDAVSPDLPKLITAFRAKPMSLWKDDDSRSELGNVIHACCRAMRSGELTPVLILDPLTDMLAADDRNVRKVGLQVAAWLGPAATVLVESVRPRLSSRDEITRQMAREALDEITTPYVLPPVELETSTDQAIVDTIAALTDDTKPRAPLFDPKLTEIVSEFEKLERGTRDVIAHAMSTRRALDRTLQAAARLGDLESVEPSALQQLARMSVQVETVTRAAAVEAIDQALEQAGVSEIGFELYLASLRVPDRIESATDIVAVLEQLSELRSAYSATASVLVELANRLLDSISGRKASKRAANQVVVSLRAFQSATHSQAFVDGFPASISPTARSDDEDAYFNVTEKGVPASKRQKRGPRSFPAIELREK